jgi:pyruvate kinase
MKTYKRAKILATIGPASDSYETIEKLLTSGVNGCRLNFSHGAHEERVRQTQWIREAAEKHGRQVAIVQDLQGPKIRLGDFEDTVHVNRDEEWQLVYGQKSDIVAKKVEIQYDLSNKVKIGERLYIFDGKIHTRVTDVGEGTVTVRVENNGSFTRRKGINLPDTDFGGDILTEKDLDDIAFGAGQDFDFVAISFVQSASDMRHLKEVLRTHHSTAKVIAKIETKAAIGHAELEAIVRESDGVMVARGDLATEVSPEVVPIVQRRIIELCQKYGKLSIVATQMMASMVDSPEPTRAEVSDVANAVIFGADCLMLSEETANGHYPVETVAAMKRVIMYTQTHAPKTPVYFREGVAEKQDAISSAAVTLAQQLGADAIVAETKSGVTAFSIASHRPTMPIISVTSDPRVAHQLSLLYANKSFLRPDGERAGLELAKELRERGFFNGDATVVLVSGRQPGLAGGTDTIRVRTLD